MTNDKYLQLKVHSAIGDAIDDNGSGYIAIDEVNDFMKYKPKDSTNAEWFC